MKKQLLQVMIVLSSALLFLVSCQKETQQPVKANEEFATVPNSNGQQGHLKQTKTYSSEVVQKWLDLKYRILRLPQEQNSPFGFFIPRFYSSLGIALYESVVPGMPAYQSLSGQLNEMPAMPATSPGMAYHWAASANAALAQTFRNFLPNTSLQNKASIDSLENALNLIYMNEVNPSAFQRSSEFGKAVAMKVFSWFNTDGFKTLYPPYILPAGPGLWQPTPPAFSTANGTHYGDVRPLIPGVINESLPPPPLPYSTTIGSAFYNSMMDVYNTTQLLILHPELKAQANYWRGTPGGSGFILWYAMLRKILSEEGSNIMLDKAAIVYCKMGIVSQDGTISMFKAKYLYNELAPVTYIRNVLGFATWNPDFPTPASPCYPEFHSMLNSACAAVLTQEFGTNYQINTDGIHPQGQPGYIFNSFADAAAHGNQSRFYAGLGTQHAVNAGAWMGNKTAEYLYNQLQFLK